jgi:hypothetical protein
MSWLAFLAALVVTLLVQTTAGRMLSLPPLDLLLALALVYGWAAPVQDARLAALLSGLAGDLMTEGPLGMRETVNRQPGWVRLLIGFVAALAGQVLIALHLHFVQGGNTGAWQQALTLAVLLSAGAALLAAIITHWTPLPARRQSMPRSPWGRR